MILDLPNWFWNAFAITVFVVINVILWFHFRWCKAKELKPKPAFQGLKKHEKRVMRWTDIFIIAIIILMTLFYGKGLFSDLAHSLSEEDPIVKEVLIKNTLASGFLLLFFYSVSIIMMASCLSPFQLNITFKKRLCLLIMCCVPWVFGVLAWAFNNTFDSNRDYFMILLCGLSPIIFINWPAIFLGKSFVECIMPLCNKIREIIPLPWFQIPVDNEMDKE